MSPYFREQLGLEGQDRYVTIEGRRFRMNPEDQVMKPLKHSKVYRYPLGHVHFKACTVQELTEFLSQFPPEMPVLTTWEGTVHSLTYPEVADADDGQPALFFDVEADERGDGDQEGEREQR